MRPIRLELEGFTAYRELTICDFEGADLFVLTGPTGSGKSSVIDAITFALYGSVSRYGNPNLVHPVVSQGRIEAKVRFDFSIEGRRYTAVRVVRRTKGGATTREARLESEGRSLAGNADEVTAQVRRILGLDFDQFTTCVVLPQGEFARFLHETPAVRQDLLTKLLGVGIYEKMGSLARIREAEAAQKAKLHAEELERIGAASETARKEAKRRLTALQKIEREIESAEPELEELERRAEEAASAAGRIACERKRLESIAVPRGLSDRGEARRQAREGLSLARAELAEAEKSLDAVERMGRDADASTLRELERLHRDLERKLEQRHRLEAEADEARRSSERLEREKCRAEAEERSARETLEKLRRDLAAHDLRAHLERGMACPVCARILEEAPARNAPPALSAAEKELSRAAREKLRAERSWQEASKTSTLARERSRAAAVEIEQLQEKLANAPEPREIAAALEAIASAEKERGTARERMRSARAKEAAAARRVEELEEEERRGWGRFDEARDPVAALGPPPVDRGDLAGAWRSLADWARSEVEARSRAHAEALAVRETAVREREAKVAALAQRARSLEIQIAPDRPRDAVVAALARAGQELEQIESAIARAAFLRESIEHEREEARVAGALGQHLRSTGFERWLLEEAFRRLVTGATGILNELSSGQYSFVYDERLNFEVIDHRNADERRSARTLSGGETFLASLALALTLAEETVELAAEGSARPESLFLDEGFGTLDDETLDVVASAIAELGAKGRVVGVVTHQQNLAATFPVQYRVSKNPVTSTITRVTV